MLNVRAYLDKSITISVLSRCLLTIVHSDYLYDMCSALKVDLLWCSFGLL